MKKLVIISLFDGISAGRVALDRAGFNEANGYDVHYYASEIDPKAIEITQKNWPDTVQLGDVRRVTRAMFRDDWLEDATVIVWGGSPCQAFSHAGHKRGFEDERGQLFWEFVRVVEEFKPKYFMLENVRMKAEHRDVITEALDVEPMQINSALHSAQNRVRLYWTNIPFVGSLEDRGILLRDILDEEGFVDRDKSFCLDANYWKGGNLKQYFEKNRRQLVFNEDPSYYIAQRGRGFNKGGLRALDGKTPPVTANAWEQNNHLVKVTGCNQVGEADINGLDCIRRVYDINAKAPTLTTMGGGHREPKIATSEITYRKLTPTECERLQGFPDDYTAGVANTHRYKALGNSWCVPTIVELFKGIEA